MPDDPRLGVLLARRREMQQRGETVCLEELCQDCPELLPTLRESLERGEAPPDVPPTLDQDGVVSPDTAPPTLMNQAAPDATPPTVIRAGEEPPAPPRRSAVLPRVPGYDVVGELGRGGMGVVYKARHLRLNRLVALKMVLAGAHASPQQLIRFQIEAQSVASLHHPNIVQVYDDGVHDECPYLALEFVEGGSLDRKLAGQQMPPNDAAQLLEQLARAIHVAHLRGIIHRDLKPGNVLLAADGTPKITDFGLAKNLKEEESNTFSGSVLGTPSYMAPEQALGKVHDIGPHSDVYALGAILYECLTGRPPFDAGSPMQTLELVQHQSVKPPSQAAGVALPRDLETICLKCLHKQPARRYESAEDLADDLQRYLNREPIRARPVGRLERLAMWARRRPAAAGLVGVTLVAVLAVIGVSVWSYFRVHAALRRAESNLTRAREAIDSFYVEFAQEWLDDAAHMDEQQERLVKRALQHYEDLSSEEGGNASLQHDQALAWMRIGQICTKLDRKDEAEHAFGRALAILERLAETSPDARLFRQDLANSHNWLGELMRLSGRREEARQHYEEAGRLQRRLREEDPEEPSYRHELARSTFNRGLILEEQKDRSGAKADYKKAIELLEEEPGQGRDSAAGLDLAKAHLNLGGLLRDEGDKKGSRREYGLAVEQLRRLRSQFPGKVEYRFELAKALKNLGNLEERDLGEFNQALLHHDEARRLLDRLADDFPTRPRYLQEQGRVYLSLGAVELRLKRHDAAEKSWQRSRDALAAVVAISPGNAEHYHELGLSARTLGWFHLRILKKPQDALEPLGQAETAFRSAVSKKGDRPEYSRNLRECLRYLAEARLQTGKVQEAAAAAAEVAAASDAAEMERYQAAGLLSRCAGDIEKDASRSEDQRRTLKAEYAEQAVRTLQSLDPAKIRKSLLADRDTLFVALKDRTDFKQLLAKVEALPTS